ncbi:hypothetical protein BDF20DRAFT_838689 [Mycotypha africana]|uniref:uncharacterized protein n=1 Tax=Mycotypha africana TaxID=64632 RepID=UPI0023012B52|nr:uncharacterized protein BDF20DRAFT_838689 [Mycotypha africana]KAI8970320.1 hypothetical protein BDF20DRAFT_838689 [Mycotypha africana]
MTLVSPYRSSCFFYFKIVFFRKFRRGGEKTIACPTGRHRESLSKRKKEAATSFTTLIVTSITRVRGDYVAFLHSTWGQFLSLRDASKEAPPLPIHVSRQTKTF